ncbi:GTP-binding protein [Georgenia deserti]|uniref:GTP-binding protein n=1 Tax=Georgenia deserti TaxID=2093781 RepID=A0ABW4L476_9MICO
MATPVLTLASIDPVMRSAAASALLCDLPGAVVVQHDLDAESGSLRRVVYDRSGVGEDVTHVLDHACASCALREDIVPTVLALAAGDPQAVVVALPTAIEPLPVVTALGGAEQVTVAGVATVVDTDTLVTDLMGQDMLADRGLAVGEQDDRSVGEVVVHQLEFADMILTAADAPGPVSQAIIAHLAGPGSSVPWDRAPVDRLLAARPTPRRGDLMRLGTPDVESDAGVWTLDLRSWRPLHPHRLLDNAETLGAGMIRGKGHFWVPSRPTLACAWDGAGGQLSVGRLGTWERRPETHLVITGLGGRPAELRQAFEETLLTDAELSRGLGAWSARADGLDPWLGAQQEEAA